MASKQTRRSISVRGTTYSLLRDFCAEHDRSMSDVVEELLSRIIDSADAKSAPKTVAPLLARAPAPKPVAQAVKQEPDRAAVRVVALSREPAPTPAPAPVPRAAMPAKPTVPPPIEGPARPTPVSNAGRPAPTPAKTVKGNERGDYRAIRF